MQQVVIASLQSVTEALSRQLGLLTRGVVPFWGLFGIWSWAFSQELLSGASQVVDIVPVPAEETKS